jgi:hypothetical protein
LPPHGLAHIASALNCATDRESVQQAVESRQCVIYDEHGVDYRMSTPQHFVDGELPKYVTRIKSCRRLMRSSPSAKPPAGAGQLTWECELPTKDIDFAALSGRETRLFTRALVGPEHFVRHV